MDYIQKTSVGIFDDAEEAIETAKEEHGEPTVTGHTPDQSQEVESEDDVQGMTDMAMGPVGEVDKDEPTSDESIEYTRSLAFKRTEAGIEPDTPEEFERAEETKERLEEIKMVNEELERQGQKRRYVASKSDAPDNAHIHEDAFGQYYYKALQIEVRPSDVAEYAGKEHHGALDKAEKAANTVEMMYALQGGPLLDANTVEAAKSWLERHLVLTDEDPGSNDTFSHEFKDQIASAISDANADEK